MQFNQIANNSIKNYNKVFSQNMESFNIGADSNGMTAFDSVLNNQMQQNAMLPQGPIMSTGIQMNVGLENMGISPIDKIDGVSSVQESSKKNKSAVENMADTFGKAFSDGLNSVNESQNAAYEAAETFASGGDISVHEVMIASQKANLTMQLALQMRNKLINAYNEINNVRV